MVRIFEENLNKFAMSTLFADGLTLFGTGTASGMVMA